MLAGGTLSGLLSGRQRDRGGIRRQVLTKKGKVVENSVKEGRQGQMRCKQKTDEVIVRQHAQCQVEC